MAKRGLGKGLGALIPTAESSSAQPPTKEAKPSKTPKQVATATPVISADVANYAEIDLDAVRPNPQQPRQVFDEEALAELTFSIKEIGLLQPIVVRRLGSPQDGAAFELIAGERRLRASKDAGLSTIPAIIRTTDDADMLRDALLENLHRADLNALEEAAAYAQMLADFGCTQEELATRIGRSRPQVTNTLRLLKLPTSVQSKVAAGVLSAGHARALLSLSSPEQMETMANRIIAEGLSVRSVEELVILGDTGGKDKERGQRQRKQRSDELEDLVAELTSRVADQLDTRVSVSGLTRKNAKGALVIEFADAEDLRRIVDVID
ncbi:MAG: ParB/RepB/Spo0J family partition protein [Candidatus Nanopelagicales bacterium]